MLNMLIGYVMHIKFQQFHGNVYVICLMRKSNVKYDKKTVIRVKNFKKITSVCLFHHANSN